MKLNSQNCSLKLWMQYFSLIRVVLVKSDFTRTIEIDDDNPH